MSEQRLPKYVYYYGMTIEELKELRNMNYISALKYKIEKAKGLLNRLVDVDLESRDFTRINHVGKAIKFNEELIDECKY